MFTDKHIEEGARHLTLGPEYFCSRDVVERAMVSVEASQFKPLVDAITKQINEAVWTGIEASLLSDTEMNLQGSMYRQVDATVRALLSGEEWAMNKYLLGSKYDCEKIRATVAKHVPAELQDQRIADLEAELDRVKKDNDWLRRR